MKSIIHKNYVQISNNRRNNIFLKFQNQFRCLMYPIYNDSELYVEYPENRYETQFNNFVSSFNHEVCFFVGFAGVGKSTFLKHHFDYQNFTIFDREGTLYIPLGWDGLNPPNNDYGQYIIEQIVNSLYNATSYIYKPISMFLNQEADEIVDYIMNTRQDILFPESFEETFEECESNKINQIKLRKTCEKRPVEFACSILKYVISSHNTKRFIKRIVFVADDTESLSEEKLCCMIKYYLQIWHCLQNSRTELIVNLIISLRPHSFRYMKTQIFNITPPYNLSWGGNIHVIKKHDIPNIKEIFKKRFEYALKITLLPGKPGNPKTWNEAKDTLYQIVENFEPSIIDMIADLCHNNIRAIAECFIMILTNRVWCQEDDVDDQYPSVDGKNYKFDIVNVVRTMACGENSVYTGMHDIQFNQNSFVDMQSRPSFDNSDVFIPNILINLQTSECDILPILIMQYLENLHSSKNDTPADTERITKELLCKNIYSLFQHVVKYEYIINVVEYLFKNRIIRKSLYTEDGEDTSNILYDKDAIYFTSKGSRLLKMLESDSVLLEIYREDMNREYKSEEYKVNALTLIKNNNRHILFDDLIKIIEEIFYSEDKYCYSVPIERSQFFTKKFVITNKLLSGLRNSLNRSTLDKIKKESINMALESLSLKINNRIAEIN